MDRKGLPKVQDAEKESLYGFVFAVSGPGELLLEGKGRACWRDLFAASTH